MRTRARFLIAFIAAFTLLPFQAFALSLREYESKTKQQRAQAAVSAIEKIITDVASVNPNLSKAIHDYFYVVPEGQLQPPGLIAFEAELVAVHNLADKGKLDLDKVQIEGILLDVVKTDVVAKQKTDPVPAHK